MRNLKRRGMTGCQTVKQIRFNTEEEEDDDVGGSWWWIECKRKTNERTKRRCAALCINSRLHRQQTKKQTYRQISKETQN